LLSIYKKFAQSLHRDIYESEKVNGNIKSCVKKEENANCKNNFKDRKEAL